MGNRVCAHCVGRHFALPAAVAMVAALAARNFASEISCNAVTLTLKRSEVSGHAGAIQTPAQKTAAKAVAKKAPAKKPNQK